MSSPMLSLRSPSRVMAYIMAHHHLRDKGLLGLALYIVLDSKWPGVYIQLDVGLHSTNAHARTLSLSVSLSE